MKLIGILSLLALAAQAAPTLESVESLVRERERGARAAGRALSLEEALAAIGDAYPELRENYVLMHDSLSRQGASYEFPRVIAHTPDARFVLAFNGDPAASGFDELEMYEFSADTPRADGYRSESFKFRRHSYHAATATVDYGPVNEPLCHGCHGENIRPNWEQYNKWEGAYPEDDRLRVGDKYYFGWKSEEHDGFDRFYTRQAGRGRYAFLRNLEERFVVGRKSTRHRADPSQFTQVVNYLNYRRVAHIIFQSPDYDRFKYATLAALYECPQFPFLVPSRWEPSLDWFVADTLSLFRADANAYHLEHDERWVGNLRYLFEGRGISMRDWSTSFRRAPYTFVTPGGTPAGFIAGVLMELDPSLEPYRVWSLSGDGGYYGEAAVTTHFVKPWTGSMDDMVREACAGLAAAGQVGR